MTSGSICCNSLPWQERWCVVMGCIWSSRLMYLVQPVPTVCGLELLILMRLLGASCWILVQSHHHCSLLGFIKVRPSLVWVIFTVILLIYNNYSSDNRQWQSYLAINFIQSIYWLFSKSNPHEVHIGLPHPFASPTRCTQVLEQKQSHKQAYLCPRQD